jgi:starvation-inducible DNA-binding protein
MKANIGIIDKNREATASVLNVLLADEHVLYIKTRNYHWNYEGDNFMRCTNSLKGNRMNWKKSLMK